MSFLYDSVLPGTTRLYSSGGADLKDNQRRLRKSQSHSGFFTPLIHLVRDPVGTIGSAVGTFQDASEPAAPIGPDDDSRKQILYLRMRNVSVRPFQL